MASVQPQSVADPRLSAPPVDVCGLGDGSAAFARRSAAGEPAAGLPSEDCTRHFAMPIRGRISRHGHISRAVEGVRWAFLSLPLLPLLSFPRWGAGLVVVKMASELPCAPLPALHLDSTLGAAFIGASISVLVCCELLMWHRQYSGCHVRASCVGYKQQKFDR